MVYQKILFSKSKDPIQILKKKILDLDNQI